jgi:hypothetical protein
MNKTATTFSALILCAGIIIPNSTFGQTTIVDVTNPTTGAIWMDRNLGATQAATSSTDVNSYGYLFQWGRSADGHQLRNSALTSTISANETPGHGDFISNPAGTSDWQLTQNDNLWQGLDGINNPCPLGYRIPTTTELTAEKASWASQDDAGAFGSVLKLPLPGARDNGGTIGSSDNTGYYWSSGVELTQATYLAFNSSVAGIYSLYRSLGLCVRCIKDGNAGMSKLDLKTNISIYPNPTTENLTIQTAEVIEYVRVYSVLGELVQNETTGSFSVAQLNDGVYTARVKTTSGITTTRFVKL